MHDDVSEGAAPASVRVSKHVGDVLAGNLHLQQFLLQSVLHFLDALLESTAATGEWAEAAKKIVRFAPFLVGKDMKKADEQPAKEKEGDKKKKKKNRNESLAATLSVRRTYACVHAT